MLQDHTRVSLGVTGLTESQLDELESGLAQSRPFGDASYLQERVFAHYFRRLDMLAEHSDAGMRLKDAFAAASWDCRRQIFGDPVLRHGINSAVCHYRLQTPAPAPWVESALLAAARHLECGILQPILGGGAEICVPSIPSHPLRLWQEDSAEGSSPGRVGLADLTTNRFKVLLASAPPSGGDAVSGAVNRLDSLLPRLTPSSLSHVNWICLVRGPAEFTSGTSSYVQATVFVAERYVDSPLDLAESLIHEALHQKFIDITQTHSIILDDIVDSPVVENPWNVGVNRNYMEWSVDRALTVAHVYVGLVAYFAALSLRLGAGSRCRVVGDPKACLWMALGRARFLLRAIAQHTERLGVGGRHFVEWLEALIGPLSTSASELPHVARGARAADPKLTLVSS